MARRRRRKEPSLLDLIPPIGALLALGLFFSPAFRQILGALLYLIVGLAVLALVGLIARAIWRNVRRTPEPDRFSPPTQSGGTSPIPVYRTAHEIEKIPAPCAAFEYANLMPLPEASRLEWSQELLSKLEWKRFEDVVAGYVRALGHEARTTRIGPDGGVDVEVLDPVTGKVGSLIQCKAWDAYRVGVKPVRELFGVMAAAKITEGAFFTTGVFTSEAREFAVQNQLDPVDGAEFLCRIRQLTPDQQATLLALATQGDYTTPTCPSCGVKMVLRTAGKGRSEGSDFWGCPNYSRGCKRTFKMSPT